MGALANATRGGRAGTVLVLAALVLSCSSIRSDDWYEKAPPPPGALVAAGPFDAMDPAGIWGVGDRVVYAIDIDDGEQRHGFTFTLTTRKLPALDQRGLAITHPAHGRVLTRSAHESWQHGPVICYHGRGQTTLHAELRGDDGTSCDGEFVVETTAHLFVEDLRVGLSIGVHEMFGALLGLDCVHTTLLRVIRKPSVLSVLARLGRIEVGLEWPPVDEMPIVEQDTPFGRLPTVWRPMTIVANDQPALDGRMQFTWKRPPLLPCAGVLQVEAWHPDDPTKRVVIRLASATRGEPPDRPDPDVFTLGLRKGMTTAEVCAATGKIAEVHERGRLADGRLVELVEFRGPGAWLVCVMCEDRLLFPGAGVYLARGYLKLHGFTPEPTVLH